MKTIQLNKMSMQGKDLRENTMTGIRILEATFSNSSPEHIGGTERSMHVSLFE